MAGPGRYYGDNPNLIEIIAALERRVSDLESGNRVGSTSIDKGSLRVLSGTFEVGTLPQLFFGPVNQNGELTPGWIFRRADGTTVFTLSGSDDFDQFWAMRDNIGNIIVSDDGVYNAGLGRPWLPIPFVSHSSTVPTDTTTSGTFTGLLSARYNMQHPKIVAQVLCRASDGSTSGEVRIINATSGDAITSVGTIGLGAYTTLTLGPNNIPNADIQEEIELEVQARRTAGAGTIGVRMLGCWGRQS